MHIEKRLHPYALKFFGVEQFEETAFSDTIFALDQYALSPVDPVVYRGQIGDPAFVIYKTLFSLHGAYGARGLFDNCLSQSKMNALKSAMPVMLSGWRSLVA